MSFTEPPVHQIRELLRLWLLGESSAPVGRGLRHGPPLRGGGMDRHATYVVAAFLAGAAR